MALLIALLATGYILPIPVINDLYLAAFAFIAYCTLVNLFWWAVEGDTQLILSSLYYPYNFGIFILVIAMMRQFRVDFVRITRVALVAAILMEVLFSLFGLVSGSGPFRAIGTFNAPNQLAYWSLLVACCYVTLKGDERLSLFDLAVLAGAGCLINLSASRAALVGFVALVLLAAFLQRLERGAKAGLVVLSLGAAIGVASHPVWVGLTGEARTAAAEGEQLSTWERSTDFGGRRHDSLAGRGYDRLWLYPEHLLIGAGEGAYDRFTASKVGDLEIHSTFGTVLFCYGIIGFALFIWLLYIIFRRAPMKHLAYAAPLALYSLTHQGLRFSLVWVFLALVFGTAQFGGFRVPRPAPKRDAPARLRRAVTGRIGSTASRAASGVDAP